METIPLKTTVAPGEDLAVEIRGASGPGTVTLRHLGRVVAETRLEAGAGVVRFPPQPRGGYRVHVRDDDGDAAATALDVLDDPMERPRYGFVSSFEEGRDAGPVVDYARRLHLNVVQFYDWMYRHAELLPPAERYEDPLGRQLSLATVRSLASALRDVGSLPLGYSAVYAVGREARDKWSDAALVRPDGSPWTLGDDFLWLVDPSDARWISAYCEQLREARTAVGFAGFHLDQYGWPKRALRSDGAEVDLASAFVSLLAHLRGAVPDARLIFNNVNDFPTWATARAPQDAVYIEVWPPHDELRHLAELIARAKLLARRKPVILAAYLSSFRGVEEDSALSAARLVMATIFSHGGFHLLTGEDGAVLTDPYYPKHHRLSREGAELLRRWYDHAVGIGDLLFGPEAVDVTRTQVLGINEEIKIDAPLPVRVDPEPGCLWARVVETRAGTVVHLINLGGQDELAWDAPKQSPQVVAGARVAFFRSGRSEPEFFFADPDGKPGGEILESEPRGGYDVVEVPAFSVWGSIAARSRARP